MPSAWLSMHLLLGDQTMGVRVCRPRDLVGRAIASGDVRVYWRGPASCARPRDKCDLLARARRTTTNTPRHGNDGEYDDDDQQVLGRAWTARNRTGRTCRIESP